MADFAITFAWLAAPLNNEERADRLLRFERDEYLKREQADKRYTSRLPEAGELYRSLIAEGRMPSGLLTDRMKTLIDEHRATGGPMGMPPLLDRAIQADATWTGELTVLGNQTFAGMYASLYASLSMVSHASASAVDRVVVGEPPTLLVGYSKPVGDEQGPYDIGCSLLTIVFLISSRRLGWPDEEDVYAASLGRHPEGLVTFERSLTGEPEPPRPGDHDAPDMT